MKRIILTLMATVTCYYCAQATFLPPGGIVVPSPNPGLPGAVLLVDHFMVPFLSNTGLVHGTATTAVYSDPFNVFGAGHLDFVYQIHNDATSVDGIARLTAINFTGFLTDVQITLAGSVIPGGIFVDGTGTASPTTADRSPFGDTVGWNFPMGSPNNIHPGDTSWVLIIETDATHFTDGILNVIDGGIAAVPAFQPTVPDSGSAVALLGIALAGIEILRRKIRAAK